MLQLFQLFLDLLILFIEQMITTLNILLKLIWFDNRYLEINSSKFNYVIYLQIMQLVFGFESFQDIIDRSFITHDKPHGLIKLYTIFKFYFLINLFLRQFFEIILLCKFLSLRKSTATTLLLITIFLILIIIINSLKGRLTQIIINGDLIVQNVEAGVYRIKLTFIQIISVLSLTLSMCCCIHMAHLVHTYVV